MEAEKCTLHVRRIFPHLWKTTSHAENVSPHVEIAILHAEKHTENIAPHVEKHADYITPHAESMRRRSLRMKYSGSGGQWLSGIITITALCWTPKLSILLPDFLQSSGWGCMDNKVLLCGATFSTRFCACRANFSACGVTFSGCFSVCGAKCTDIKSALLGFHIKAIYNSKLQWLRTSLEITL